MRFGCISLVALLLGTVPGAASNPEGTRHALLVGCTRYPQLAAAYQLEGPANDVRLLHNLLVERFAFPRDHVTILAEGGADGDRPLRANIERAFRRLAQVAGPGDQVVISLAGHGSRQPESDPDNPDNYEPDGLDQVFLPADAGPWDDGSKRIRNAIIDKELKAWLQAIRARGAHLVVIVDACHAASMVRGSDAEVTRQVPAGALVPAAVLDAARRRAASRGGPSRGATTSPAPFHLPDLAPDLVAIYAAQRTEPTIEKRLPPGSPNAKPHGLLTYTLVQVLTRAATPLTYTELVQRIQAQYVAWDRRFPTPLVEGKDRDREFLGRREWPGRSRFLISKDEDGGWKVNAGALHGLTTGSVLAVYPPAGEAGADRLVGHVRVTRLQTLEAGVEPCAFAGRPAPTELPRGGRCQSVYTDYGSQRLRVAVDGAVSAAERERLDGELRRLAASGEWMIEAVSDPAAADWLVRTHQGQVLLVPASGAVARPGLGGEDVFGPVPLDDRVGPWLGDSLRRIGQARNLLALASAVEADSRDEAEALAVDVELLRYPDAAPGAAPIKDDGDGRRHLQSGEFIAFRLHNRSRATVDVSLLFIDSGYGIAPFFPVPGTTTDNRLSAGQTITTPRGRVTARTLGLEHMVVIAVQARPGEQPVDFSCLAQPTLPQAVARAAGTRSATIDSPLGRLLQFSLYRAGSERGMVRAALADHSLKVLSWEVAPAAAREDTNPTVTSWDGISWEKPVLYVAGIFLAATVVMVARRRAR